MLCFALLIHILASSVFLSTVFYTERVIVIFSGIAVFLSWPSLLFLSPLPPSALPSLPSFLFFPAAPFFFFNAGNQSLCFILLFVFSFFLWGECFCF